MILHDRYAGYRDWTDPRWDWERAPYVDESKWTDWDYSLASVAQLIEDYTDKNNGQLYWIDASDKVSWELKSSYSGYDAAIDKDDKNLEPGESRYAVPVFDEDDPPTISEWIESLEDETNHPPGYKNTGIRDWEILDAKDDAEKRRAEIKEKLLRGEAL
jgi:hypothetical protein